ncbi:MAG: hypothetical protein Q4A32_00855 [Lachnospiraceae bacterium]|nr:hypothetical protein [Lachnospiraceae bacterium]
MEGYHQITLSEWMEQKEQLRRELDNVREGFIRVGYVLRKMEESRAYEAEGYKSVAEFAEKVHGLKPSTTSRWMAINREFSLDGYSMQIDPKYANMNFSQLAEMLTISVEDREMVRPETQREAIRELKRLEKEEPMAGSGFEQIVRLFLADNPILHTEIVSWMMFRPTDQAGLIEKVNPSGNRSYRKNGMMLMMYEDYIKYKAAGKKPETVEWSEFFEATGKVELPKLDEDDSNEVFGAAKNDEEEGTDGDAAVENAAEEAGAESPAGSFGEVEESRGMDDERREKVDGGHNGEIGTDGSLPESWADGDGDRTGDGIEGNPEGTSEGSGAENCEVPQGGAGESESGSNEGRGNPEDDGEGDFGSGGPHDGTGEDGIEGAEGSKEERPAAAGGIHEASDYADEETESAAPPPVAEDPSDTAKKEESSGSLTDDFPFPENVEDVEESEAEGIAPAQFAKETIVDEDGNPADEEDEDGDEEMTIVGKIHNTISEVRYCIREISSKVDYRKWDEAYAAAVELTGYLDFLVGHDME